MADAWPVRVCHIKQNGEFLIEIPHCRSVRYEEEPGGHLLIIATFPHYEAIDTTGVYVLDKASGSVTDSIFAVSYDGIVQDGEMIVVMMSYRKHLSWEPFLGMVNMPKAHELRSGNFTEIDPGPYADWARIAARTAMNIGYLFYRPMGPCSHDLNPDMLCEKYHRSCKQLREVFTYIDRYALSAGPGGSGADGASSEALVETEAHLDALHGHGLALHKTKSRIYTDSALFMDALRELTDALYADTGLSWLYKQGRYHVMDGTTLLWSTPTQALSGPLGIAEAPGGRLLFILGRPSPWPQPGDITVWTYDRKMRTVTDTLSLTAVKKIAHDGKTLILTEGWNGIGFKAPYAPLQSRPHIFSNGRWTVGSKEYTAQQNRFGVSPHHHLFIARLHLECKGDMNSCSHYKDFARAPKDMATASQELVDDEDRLALLDGSKVKAMPAQSYWRE